MAKNEVYQYVKINDILKKLNSLLEAKEMESAMELLNYIFDNQMMDLTASIDYINGFGECKFCGELLIRTDQEVLQLRCGHYFHYPCLKKMLINLFGDIPSEAQICHSCAYCVPEKEEEKSCIPKHRLDAIFKEDLDEKYYNQLKNEFPEGGGYGYEYTCSKCLSLVFQAKGHSNRYFKLDCEHGICVLCLKPQVKKMVDDKQHVLCPMEGCEFHLTEDQVYQVIGAHFTQQKMETCFYVVSPYKACPFQTRNNVSCDGKLSYPKLNIEEEQKKVPVISSCSKCEHKYCIKCFEKEHPDKTCEQQRNEIAERFENLIQGHPETQINQNNNYLRCPHCYRLIEKEFSFDPIAAKKCDCGNTFGICDKCEPTRTFKREQGNPCIHLQL